MPTKAPQAIPAAIAAAYPSRVWSAYQADLFAHLASPEAGSAVVRAVAGSGKTTSIVAGLKGVPAGTSVIFLAFNKSIATELSERGVPARTFHSLTFSPVTRACEVKGVETNKLRELIKVWPRETARLYANAAQKLVGLGRNDGIGCLTPETPDTWLALAERHDVAPDSEEGNEAGMVAAASRLLAECNASPLCDFDDLLYRAVSRAVPLPRYDLVLVDEAQDTNAIQRAILRKILGPKGRVVAVGDAAQAIYGFRGADSGAMDLLARDFGAKALPLSITYRCARSIVAYARQWAPLEAAEGAPEGTVAELGSEWALDLFKPADLVVCRTNAPLLKLAYSLIRARKPVHVMGREIGAGLVSLINKLQPKGIDGLLEKLGAWQDRETLKLQARDASEAQIAAVADKADSIRVMVEGLPENSRTVPELCRTIEGLFAGGPEGKIVLASIHKSKGLEAEHVVWLERSACPSRWAKQAWQQEQERNLCYVAATRAKSRLTLIDFPK
jgi:hypothetical protein